MRKYIYRRLVYIGATFLVLSGSIPPLAEASERELDKDVIKTTEMKYAEKETQDLAVLAAVLAQPEPQEWIDARNNRIEAGRKKAETDAKEASAIATKEAQEKWHAAFPVVAGNSREAVFFNSISKVSVEIAHTYGIFPSVMMAQAGLESGWGGSDLAAIYHNYFGVKGSHEGQSVTMRTREESNGNSFYINAGFAHYPSPKESMVEYAKLMKNGPGGNSAFYSGTWRADGKSYKDATLALQGRYATDGIYAEKLNHVIQLYGLERFDAVPDFNDIRVDVEPVYPVEPALADDQYRVKAEDSMLSIAILNKVTPAQIMKWNNLTEPVIYVNQILIIKEQGVQPITEAVLGTPSAVKKAIEGLNRKETIQKERQKEELVLKVSANH